MIAAGGLLLFFGAVIGLETGFGHLRVMNLPMVIMGGVGLLSGVILYAASSMVTGNFQLTNFAMRPSEPSIVFDRNKWSALVKYDDVIALIAEKLKPLGQRWVDEFASSYLALDDKSYLPNLVHKIIAEAKKENDSPPLEGQQNAADDLTRNSVSIPQRAEHVVEQVGEALPPLEKWSTKDHATVWGGVPILLALIAFLWFSGSEKILKPDGSAMRPDSQPKDQQQYELQASDTTSIAD